MKNVYLNGKILASDTAKISINDRSYLFGEGLFESFRSYDGKIPLLEEHIKRLTWSATFLNLPFPDDVDFKEVCEELLEANELKEARFKIVLSQNAENEPNLVIFCTPLEQDKKIYKLKTVKAFTADALPLATMKTTSYLTKILARAEAKEAGFDDGILVNARGNVTETTSGNIFWVDEKGILNTISEASGMLRGIMKQEVLKLLQANKLNNREGIITPQDLSNAKEVFITNSVIGIKPVSHVDHRMISGGETGSITAMIQDLLKKKLEK